MFVISILKVVSVSSQFWGVASLLSFPFLLSFCVSGGCTGYFLIFIKYLTTFLSFFFFFLLGYMGMRNAGCSALAVH